MTTYLPELTLVGHEFLPNYAVSVNEDGLIAAVEPAADDTEGRRLPRQALIPGLVNCHSHAFQRAIRGRTEYRRPERAQDDFWTWRELMYAAATSLDPDEVEAVSRMAFVEMVLSGITSVGEFHYLHHNPDGTPYEDPDELSCRVMRAAEDAGLTPVLLRVAYHRGGQPRFLERDLSSYLASLDRLRSRGYRVGVTPHSVRAVPRDWFAPLWEYAERHDLPVHMHLAEQPRELEECRAEHGATPVELLRADGLLSQRFTGVHVIHLSPSEIAAFGAAGAGVCSCPTTERNLGDGVVPARELLEAGARFCFGSDSNCQIDLLEDARELEYHVRLVERRRAVLAASAGRGELARRLFSAATEDGAVRLGLDTGRLAPGLAADMVAVDLADPCLCGAAPEDLLDTIVFAMERTAVRGVWCRGRHLVQEGRHLLQKEAIKAFAPVMQRLREA